MMSDFTQQLKCYSDNVNGLNSSNKRKRIFNQVKKGKYNIVALQEMHTAQKHTKYLIQNKLGKEYFSSAEEKKKRVVLYVDKNVPSELQFKDQEGRMIAVKIKIGLKKYFGL